MLEIRVMQVFAYTNLSRMEFAGKLNISNAVLSHISSGRNKAGMELVTGILTQFPEISPDWLLFGKGEMMRMDENRKVSEFKKDVKILLDQVKQTNADLEMKISSLEKRISELE